jgi:hypothetical protein
MGLDMYLTARKYVSGWQHSGGTKEISPFAAAAGFPMDRLAEHSPHGYAEFCVGYWRKANAIHSWFVDHVQNGTDDCGSYYVPRESLTELQAAVQEAYTDRSSTALEPVSGFFFGSQSKDRWYYQDLKYTNLLIDELLGDKRLDNWEFSYHSSW